MADTSGSSALSTARPSGASASTSSPLATAIWACEPNSPMCALPTLSTSETSGGAIAHSSARWPTPRAPISRTRKRVRSSARSTVSGRPSSLLNDPAVATVGASSASTRASMSFAVVLPWDPVIATTVSRLPLLAPPGEDDPRELLERGLGVVDEHGGHPGGAAPEDRGGTALDRARRVVVAVDPLAREGDEQAARLGDCGCPGTPDR